MVNDEVNVDVLGEVDGNYGLLYSLYLSLCTFSNLEKFERFLAYMQKSEGLTRLTLYLVKLKSKAVLSKRFLEIVQRNPIRYFHLW